MRANTVPLPYLLTVNTKTTERRTGCRQTNGNTVGDRMDVLEHIYALVSFSIPYAIDIGLSK